MIEVYTQLFSDLIFPENRNVTVNVNLRIEGKTGDFTDRFKNIIGFMLQDPI